MQLKKLVELFQANIGLQQHKEYTGALATHMGSICSPLLAWSHLPGTQDLRMTF